MKAILINPEKKEVTEVEYSGDYQDIYKLIDCKTFDVVRTSVSNDGIYVDDEGLFVDDQLFFEYGGDAQSVRLAGNGLILGVDDEGNSISPQTTVEEVEGRVGFLPRGYSW